ncbi:hypothetical protein BZB76_1837 [Actinomadura pelletieri DSM 43383]|uniref:Uncharacterized protein n=1 Tax=Actinomadura pelletieri DSM 43383 TaxID=1120940 RepID=A0A495QST7_9ACTN|nr:hypothetical protein [Actinomadura pelletieri]RKS76481.1 hypothetical protein BZB76_1837 [Actinomadura pelletieri DSM 43383]
MRPKPDDYPAAVEWREANQELDALCELIRKTGDVDPDDYAAARRRVDDAAAAITIPARLMTFDPDDWPGRTADNVGFTQDPLRRREQFRQAQDEWATDRGLWRGDFEELQRRQAERTTRRTRKTKVK